MCGSLYCFCDYCVWNYVKIKVGVFFWSKGTLGHFKISSWEENVRILVEKRQWGGKGSIPVFSPWIILQFCFNDRPLHDYKYTTVVAIDCILIYILLESFLCPFTHVYPICKTIYFDSRILLQKLPQVKIINIQTYCLYVYHSIRFSSKGE